MVEKHGAAEESKRKRPIRTLIVCVVMFLIWLTKPFKGLQNRFPYKLRELARSWDSAMIWSFILSFGTRVYSDQNCILKDPPNFKPLVQTKPEVQFTEEQIRNFYRDGFIGPITLWTPEEMKEIRERVLSVTKRPSAVYPKAANHLRDRYLDAPEFWELISAPQIVERLAQLLGPDLMIWRSQIFNKNPGDPEITWHQASTYMSEQRYKAVLEPKDINHLFQLTTWIAIDDADYGNGCMHFVKGSQRRVWTLKLNSSGEGFTNNPSELARVIAGKGRFALGTFSLDTPINDQNIVPMPLKAGQCVIVHGSPPNTSDRRRFGFVFRTIRTDVQVYREEATHNVSYLSEEYDLANWGCALLRGEDKNHHNRMLPAPQYAPNSTAESESESMAKSVS